VTRGAGVTLISGGTGVTPVVSGVTPETAAGQTTALSLLMERRPTVFGNLAERQIQQAGGLFHPFKKYYQ